MKKMLTAISVLMLMTICGCTQNNGYIGPFFGSWSLIEISADGIPLELQGETVFSFQNEVVRVSKLANNPFDEVSKYGNFSISEDILSLKFLTELTPDGKGYTFLMPNWLYFPEGEMPLNFYIVSLKGSRMVLSLNDGGREITYKFDKTW